ncbi:hypothetical protein [Loktanella sp. S4079]|uniref:hypothetical protein n=1 Tax=Loktanella sp. S4079 TaxID=579483 RepID=UPI0005FA22C7|nr:hypothetical protein [Loktanella sp. S4079]KJZ18421.1 hypothetical protein TW80_13270 [Loktanella sp. S4079]
MTTILIMAKTRSKPNTSKKSEAVGSAAPDRAADIRTIPLNVRKVAAIANHEAECFANIRETGIKRNLLVHAPSETRFAVDDGIIPVDHLVP